MLGRPEAWASKSLHGLRTARWGGQSTLAVASRLGKLAGKAARRLLRSGWRIALSVLKWATVIPRAPRSEAELLERAQCLAGRSLGDVARQFGRKAPADLRRDKGFVGQLFELALGATAGSRAKPDFEHLGIELKSIPVDPRGAPLETTFVCTIDLLDVGRIEWEQSRVRSKLARVLWMPVLGLRDVPVPERAIGTPLIWSPTAQDEADLRWDWEELAGLIGRGDVDEITGHLGKVMQVRPKAANSMARRRAQDVEGWRVDALPRGFYLRTSFTARILEAHFRLPDIDR